MMTDQAASKVDYKTGEESLNIEGRLDPHEPLLQPVVRSSTGSRQSRSLVEAMKHARMLSVCLAKNGVDINHANGLRATTDCLE